MRKYCLFGFLVIGCLYLSSISFGCLYLSVIGCLYLCAPFSLLINKINSYTYDFHAQEKLATLKEINAMAVVAYNRVTKITTETLASYPRDVKWNLEIFSNRDDALAWLLSEQGKTGNDHNQRAGVLKSNSPAKEEIC